MKLAGARHAELDLLRFLAAAAVVLFHYTFRGYQGGAFTQLAFPELSGVTRYGYLGVNLFFLISGYVIFMSAEGKSAADFAKSRFVRLYPAYWFACAATFTVAAAWGAPAVQATPAELLVNLTMLQGFVGVRHLDGVYWTLAVELRFYALVFAVLALGGGKRLFAALTAWFVIAAASDLLGAPAFVQKALAHEYSAYFAAGAAFYLVRTRGAAVPAVIVLVLAVGWAAWKASLYANALSAEYGTAFAPGAAAGAVVAFAALFGLLAATPPGRLRWGWALPLGALTYPLYLLHQNIGYVAINALDGRAPRPAVLALVTLGALAAAWAVQAYVERPAAKKLKKALA